jgi:hypothetical protein
MTFHIGQQNAGVINIAGRDQRIHGGQQGMVTAGESERRAVRELRAALATSNLDETNAAEARAQVAEIDAALHAPRPDRSRVARTLERLTRLLAAAGTLTTAGIALIGPLQTLAGWLGDLGEPILRLLPT